jgi:GGDEF domain-containing protein
VRDSVVQAAPILATQRNLALAQLRAASDALTGLPNRRAADETLNRMVAHAGRAVSPLAGVLLDLDHFKQVNDLHGHELGDKALAAVGQILISTLRTSDFAARYGGEEFLVLLPDTPCGGRSVCRRKAARRDRGGRHLADRAAHCQLRRRRYPRRRLRRRADDPQGRSRALRSQGRWPQPGRDRSPAEHTRYPLERGLNLAGRRTATARAPRAEDAATR